MEDMSTDSVSVPRPEPLNAGTLHRELVRPGGLWRSIEVVAATASTNTDLLRRAREGAPEGTVLAAEHQTAGRGRLDRSFHTAERAALTFSLLVRPNVPAGRHGWLPLLMGVAVAAAIEETTGLRTGLKWPNDVLTASEEGERKLVGILAEATASGTGTAIVIGTGMNISQSRAELPVPTATSLAAEGVADTDRTPLLKAILRGFEQRYRTWGADGGDAVAGGLAQEYRGRCTTLGRRVRVHLPGDKQVAGSAAGVDTAGRLLLRGDDGARTVLSSGDVVHVRSDR